VRLTLVISSLGCGGAERVMTNMANYWADRGAQVTLLTLDDGSKPPCYKLDDRVSHIALGLAEPSPNFTKALLNNLKRIRALRRSTRLSQADAVISFMEKTNVITLLATRGLRLPVLVSERINPAMHSVGVVWDRLRRWTYPLADRVIIQTDDVLGYFPPRVQSRTSVIPNPVLQPLALGDRPVVSVPTPSIVAMGRLERQKGFDLLLRSFSRLSEELSHWNLVILGEGPLRSELEALRDELGLSKRVAMPGNMRTPHEVLSQAELFVMSSRFEGFPNALCEAMSCGLPVISTDCPSGPRNIVRHEIDGLLVPNQDVEALAKAMNRLMGSETDRKRFGARAVEVCERFSVDKAMHSWDQVLRKVTLRRMTIEPVKSRAILQ